DAATARRIRIVEARTERIARRRFEHHGSANLTQGNLLLRRRIPGIEAAHETHLKERSRLVDRVRHRGAFGEAERRRFLAEGWFLGPSSGDDDPPARMGL